MSRTWSSVNLELGLITPMVLRRLATMSALFSALVPGRRWLGLQQAGLSQLWRTHGLPDGSGPCVRTYATTWA